MSWFRVADRRLLYRGRITQPPVAAWIGTEEGASAIDAVATRAGLRIFPRSRARRRIWRELDRASRTEPLRSAIQSETDHFRAAMAELSYADGLPRVQVGLQRLVIVPRTLVAGRARAGLHRRVGPLMPQLDDLVSTFLCEQLLAEMDRAIEEARPSASRPVHVRDEWSCVGGDRQYVWVDPMWSGPAWSGHVVMYEYPSAGLASRERKHLDRAIQELQQSVTTLSLSQRETVVRMASGTSK